MKSTLIVALVATGLVNGSAALANDTVWSVPKHVLGFVAGSLVGTPICVVRKFKDEEVNGIEGTVGKDANVVVKAGAALFWMPMSMFATALEAPVFAIKNSWMAEEPFSKEQFSLGEDL